VEGTENELWYREDELQDVLDTLPQLGTETFEDQTVQSGRSGLSDRSKKTRRKEDELRVGFADCRSLEGAKRVAKDDAGEGEEDSWAVREMGEHESIGNATVLVNDDEVGHLVCSARVGEFFHDVVTAIDAGRVGDNEAEFLRG
jgi:hypothetical protein